MSDIQQFRDRVMGRDLGSEHSVNQYCSWIQRFNGWRDSDKITEATLRDFDSTLDSGDVSWRCPDDGYAQQTRVMALSAVALWGRVMEDTTIGPDVTDLVRGDPDEFNPTILDRGEIESVLADECSNPCCEAARRVGYDAIMRAEEVARAEPQDIDPEQGTIYVRSAKGSLPRTIGVERETMDALAEQRERVRNSFSNPSKLFYNAYWNGWSGNSWSQHFRRAHHEAGFHAFARHSACVHYMEDHGFGETYVRARHKQPSTTARYCSVAGVARPEWA